MGCLLQLTVLRSKTLIKLFRREHTLKLDSFEKDSLTKQLSEVPGKSNKR